MTTARKSLRGNLSCSMEHLGTPSMSTPTAVSRSNPVTPPTVNRSAATSPHRGSKHSGRPQSIRRRHRLMEGHRAVDRGHLRERAGVQHQQRQHLPDRVLRQWRSSPQLAEHRSGRCGRGTLGRNRQRPRFPAHGSFGTHHRMRAAATERDVAGLQHHARHDRGHPARGNG